jgi:outer membrane protein assembly factor BamB
VAKVKRLWLAAAAVLLVGVGVVGYRVLAPTETVDPAVTDYPSATVASPRRLGALTSMPLILDDRLRVYAEKRRVWADTPMDAHNERSPYWAYRRWPAQVVGVVAVGAGFTDARPVVVSRWSDGALVGVDARTGRVAWRASVAAGGAYAGRLTGAATVYTPSGMYTAGGVLVVVSGRQVLGFDPRSGTRRWTLGLSSCQSVGWTGASSVVVRDSCDGDVLRFFSAPAGQAVGSWPVPASGDGAPDVVPWGCAVGRSGCVMFQVGSSEWSLGGSGLVVAEPHAKPGDLLLGDDAFVEWRADAYVSVVDRASGAQRWVMPLPGSVVAADERGVYAVGPRDTLLVYDPASGHPMWRLAMRDTELGRYSTGQVYLYDHYLAIERITGKPNQSDSRYYFGTTPVLLMAV